MKCVPFCAILSRFCLRPGSSPRGLGVGCPVALTFWGRAATRAAPTFDRRGPGRHKGRPYDWVLTKGHEGGLFLKSVPFCLIFAFAPGLVPEGEGVLRQAQDERMLCRRSAPTVVAGGPGRPLWPPYEGRYRPTRFWPYDYGGWARRPQGPPLRRRVIASVSLFLGCILMVEMGYAGWQGGSVGGEPGCLFLAECSEISNKAFEKQASAAALISEYSAKLDDSMP